MADAVKAMHGGIEITYNEHPNNWTFTLRGKERVAPTLKQAKETIDKPVAHKDADRFDRFEAFTNDYSFDALLPCTVTSEIEGRYYSGAKIGSDKYRITVVKKGEKETKQVYATRIYPRTPENCRIKTETDALQVQIDALATQKNALLKGLTTLEDENLAKEAAAQQQLDAAAEAERKAKAEAKQTQAT
jgi:hypothetical protein